MGCSTVSLKSIPALSPWTSMKTRSSPNDCPSRSQMRPAHPSCLNANTTQTLDVDGPRPRLHHFSTPRRAQESAHHAGHRVPSGLVAMWRVRRRYLAKTRRQEVPTGALFNLSTRSLDFAFGALPTPTDGDSVGQTVGRVDCGRAGGLATCSNPLLTRLCQEYATPALLWCPVSSGCCSCGCCWRSRLRRKATGPPS